MRNHALTCATSNTSSKQTERSKNTEAHKTLWTQTSSTGRLQQHKTNMENHRSLQRTLLQAEIQKNSEKQPFMHSDSKKNRKEIPDLRP
jgi:hypothetical protein